MDNLLNIPVEVIIDNILPYLSWNDLLRFRRVSKVTQDIVTSFLEVRRELTPEIEIKENDKDKSVEEFLKINLPTTRIFLNNVSGEAFYQQLDENTVVEFIEKYGHLINHLRVKQISLYCCGKEWEFINSLQNLQTFEAEYFGIGTNTSEPSFDIELAIEQEKKRALEENREEHDIVPTVFKQLTRVKIGQQNNIVIANIIDRTEEFLERCQGLEHLSLPFNSKSSEGLGSLALAFQYLNDGIEERANLLPEMHNVSTIDFVNYHDDTDEIAVAMQIFGPTSATFLELCVNSLKYNVKLTNVCPFWFIHRTNVPNYNSPDLGWPILSMVNMHPCVLPLSMPNLERIEIRKTSLSSAGRNWMQNRPAWPSLKSLDISVDAKQDLCMDMSTTNNDHGQQFRIASFSLNTKTLFQFFFQDIRRTNLTELRLNFIKEKGHVAIPKMDDIACACPNLKRLTIINWPGTNKSLTKLWSSASCLQEISLEYCKELGNVAFVGEDVQNPAFLKLKKLKKLSLKGLDRMPKITDTLFSLVIRHLKLTHFTLTSDQPVKAVTPVGVLSLLEGNFAGSIEKFSFKEWSLVNVPSEKFKNIEEKFRSYNML